MQKTLYVLAGLCFLIWLLPILYRNWDKLRRSDSFYNLLNKLIDLIPDDKETKKKEEDERMRKVGQRGLRYK